MNNEIQTKAVFVLIEGIWKVCIYYFNCLMSGVVFILQGILETQWCNENSIQGLWDYPSSLQVLDMSNSLTPQIFADCCNTGDRADVKDLGNREWENEVCRNIVSSVFFFRGTNWEIQLQKVTQNMSNPSEPMQPKWNHKVMQFFLSIRVTTKLLWVTIRFLVPHIESNSLRMSW